MDFAGLRTVQPATEYVEKITALLMEAGKTNAAIFSNRFIVCMWLEIFMCYRDYSASHVSDIFLLAFHILILT